MDLEILISLFEISDLPVHLSPICDYSDLLHKYSHVTAKNALVSSMQPCKQIICSSGFTSFCYSIKDKRFRIPRSIKIVFYLSAIHKRLEEKSPSKKGSLRSYVIIIKSLLKKLRNFLSIRILNEVEMRKELMCGRIASILILIAEQNLPQVLIRCR